MFTGTLPWAAEINLSKLREMKEQVSVAKLFEGMPSELVTIYGILERLAPFEVPDYYLLIALMVRAMGKHGCTWDDPYDWEKIPPSVMKTLTLVNMTYRDGDRPNIPTDLPELGEST
jgi:hypothetical protein